MAFLLMLALLSATGTYVYSANNKTNCDFRQNAKSCTQQSCVQSPCTMLCGLTTQFDTCHQLCGSRVGKCDALKCLASSSCQQICTQNNCGSLYCDAKDCGQSCSQASCGSMVCPKTVNSCSQGTGSRMICEANACTQVCNENYCRMTCPVGGKNCTQQAIRAGAAIECDRGLCIQACISDQCNMSCSSSVSEGSCQQVCTNSRCEFMLCSATKCSQSSSKGEGNMICPLGVESCQQVAVLANITMQCDADVCEQVCNKGNCNMTCSTRVKECHQTCSSGECLYKCDADNCKLDCLQESACTRVKPASIATTKECVDISLQIGIVFTMFLLTL